MQQQQSFCTNCGYRQAPSSAFCVSCGAPLNAPGPLPAGGPPAYQPPTEQFQPAGGPPPAYQPPAGQFQNGQFIAGPVVGQAGGSPLIGNGRARSWLLVRSILSLLVVVAIIAIIGAALTTGRVQAIFGIVAFIIILPVILLAAIRVLLSRSGRRALARSAARGAAKGLAEGCLGAILGGLLGR